MSIDLTIEGDPSGVYELATWLDAKISTPIDDLHKRLKKTTTESADYWRGRTGEGFRDSSNAITAAIDPVDIYASDASEVFRAYARRIERGRYAFADYIDDARGARLLVNGNIVNMPEAPQAYIAAPGAPNPYATGPNGESVAVMTGDDFAEAERVYARIAEQVESWWVELEDWIIEYMVPLIARATDFDALTAAYETLKVGNDALRGFPIALSQRTWSENLMVFEQRLKEAQVARDSLAERRRSGNKAVSEPAKGTDRAKLRLEADALAEQVRVMKIGKRLLGAGGAGVEIIAAGVEIANGGSWTSATIGAVGSLGGGAIAAGTLAAIGSGPVVLVVGVLGGSLVVSDLARSGWETLVPLDVREAIDAWDFDYVFD